MCLFLSLGHSRLEFVSDFDIRISYFFAWVVPRRFTRAEPIRVGEAELRQRDLSHGGVKNRENSQTIKDMETREKTKLATRN